MRVSSCPTSQGLPPHTQHAGHAQALLEHGRLRYDQLLRYVAEQQDAREAELAGTVEACFLRLLHAQQVERVPSCDLPPPVDAARSAASVNFLNLNYLIWTLLIAQSAGIMCPCGPLEHQRSGAANGTILQWV